MNPYAQSEMNLLTVLQYLVACSLLSAIGWTFWSTFRETIAIAQQMHKIPCATCRYFTNDYRLKCSVHPFIANTEEAINCSDYRLN